MVRTYLLAGASAAVALTGVAIWLADAGYQRGKADCRAEAQRIRTEIEGRWVRDADQIVKSNQERSDAVAAIDAVDAGDALCLPPDSVQRLGTIK